MYIRLVAVFGGLHVVSVSGSVWWFACIFVSDSVWGFALVSVSDSVWWFACTFG